MDRHRVLTWHVHGSYLEALARVDIDWYLPVLPDRPTGYGGRPPSLAGVPNVHEVPAEEVRDLELDAVLFQSAANYLEDQHRILSEAQRRLPRVFLEHDPPRESPTETRHVVDDPEVLLVHCTAFNALMWDAGRTPTRVIDHGVAPPAGLAYGGDLERGIVVVNDIATRGRRLGADLFLRFREWLPLDLVGLRSELVGGLGAIPHDELAPLESRYRFFFHPARYTSLGLAVIEAMMLGLPVVALATTEMPTVLEDGRSGIVSTDPAHLLAGMRELLADPGLARRLGAAGREVALERFGIDRFARDWERTFDDVAGRPRERAGAGALPTQAAGSWL
jgi:Glycosyl transferases group 1